MTLSDTITQVSYLLEDFKEDKFDFVFDEPDYETGKAQYISTLEAALVLLESLHN